MKIAVLFGGDSMERDVSIASASQVVGALRGLGHDVISVDSGRGLLTAADERLFTGRIDKLPPDKAAVAACPRSSRPRPRQRRVMFFALHGGSGGSGTVQALLDLAGIPYTGGSLLAARSAGTRTSRSGCSSRPACRRRNGSWRPRRSTT